MEESEMNVSANRTITDQDRRTVYSRLDPAEYQLVKILAEDEENEFSSVCDVVRTMFRRGLNTFTE